MTAGSDDASPAVIATPSGLTDATLSPAERRELERSLVGFLARLDELWDAGALPQTFTAG